LLLLFLFLPLSLSLLPVSASVFVLGRAFLLIFAFQQLVHNVTRWKPADDRVLLLLLRLLRLLRLLLPPVSQVAVRIAVPFSSLAFSLVTAANLMLL
jgi:hypothetical protein